MMVRISSLVLITALLGMVQTASAEPSENSYMGSYRSIFDHALTFLGRPYGYGKKNASSIDCSGFTQEVYNRIGIRLPRSVIEQSRMGKNIDLPQIREGDLLFFYRGDKSIPSHVAIYVGERKIIHASYKAKRVHFDTIDKPFYRKHFLFAKRLLTEETLTAQPPPIRNLPPLITVPKNLPKEDMVASFPPSSIKIFRNYQLFEGREVILSTEGKALLRRWMRSSFSQKNRSLRINVHTDSAPPQLLKERFSTNQALSQARAEVIAEYLSTLGIDPSRIIAQGMGDSQPIASEDTPEGQSRNRRVEFLF
jgi:flagellar motor protein MotB